MIQWICVVTWMVLAVVVGLWSDLWHSHGYFYPLFVLLCSPPIFAVAALVSGRMKATVRVEQRSHGPRE